MTHLQIRWHRLFGIYFVIAGLCLFGGCEHLPATTFLLVIGVGMVIAFVPIVMAIYFMKGVLRIP